MADLMLSEAEQSLAQTLERDAAIELLASKDRRKVAIAVAALERMGESVGDLLLDRLRVEAVKRRRKRALVLGGFGAYGVVLIVALAAWAVVGISTGNWPDFPWQLFQAFSYMGILGSVGAATQFQRGAVELIARFDDVKFVPELITALDLNDKSLAQIATPPLTNLLPRLTASDSSLLDGDRRGILRRHLIHRHPVTLQKAILKALEQVGDERDLPAVKKLAEGEAATAREKELREAARACLPYVEHRAAQHRASQTLLRAAAGSIEVDSLLRPAESTLESDACTLVRPVESASLLSAETTVDSAESESVPLRNI